MLDNSLRRPHDSYAWWSFLVLHSLSVSRFFWLLFFCGSFLHCCCFLTTYYGYLLIIPVFKKKTLRFVLVGCLYVFFLHTSPSTRKTMKRSHFFVMKRTKSHNPNSSLYKVLYIKQGLPCSRQLPYSCKIHGFFHPIWKWGTWSDPLYSLASSHY